MLDNEIYAYGRIINIFEYVDGKNNSNKYFKMFFL